MTRRKKVVLLVVLGVAVALVSVFVYRVLFADRKWTQPGSFVAAGSKDELWIFLEMDYRRYKRPLISALVDYPTVSTTGWALEVIVLNKDGLREHRSFPKFPVPVDPGMSVLWHTSDTFLLYNGPSMGDSGSLWEWHHDGFRNASARTTTDSSTKEIVSEIYRTAQELAARESKRHGWDLSACRRFDDRVVRWRGSDYAMSFWLGRKGMLELHVHKKDIDGKTDKPFVVVKLPHCGRERRTCVFSD